MGIFSRKKNKPVEERSEPLGGLHFNGISPYSGGQNMRLSAVYAAVNQISNSCALLPINVVKIDSDGTRKQVQHQLNEVLNLRPDNKLTHYTFIKMMMESVMLKGEAFALIIRDDNLNVIELKYIDADYVTPQIIGGQVKYIVAGMQKAVDAINMIHLYQHVDEQMNGISVIKYASKTLASAVEAEKHSSNFFKSGANLSGIIKASATLTNDQKKQIRESWTQAFANNSETASVAVLPAGLDYQAISVSPEDSQLLESRKYNVIEIARFFNISPIKLFDLSSSSYGSLEQTQLNYLQDTIYPYIKMMEDEFNLKLFRPSEVGKKQVSFDFTTLMSTDKATEASYYKEMLTNGILSLNEVRAKLGFAPIEDGDKHYMQLSYTTTENINSGILTNNQQQVQLKDDEQLDNKVKGKNKE